MTQTRLRDVQQAISDSLAYVYVEKHVGLYPHSTYTEADFITLDSTIILRISYIFCNYFYNYHFDNLH